MLLKKIREAILIQMRALGLVQNSGSNNHKRVNSDNEKRYASESFHVIIKFCHDLLLSVCSGERHSASFVGLEFFLQLSEKIKNFPKISESTIQLGSHCLNIQSLLVECKSTSESRSQVSGLRSQVLGLRS